MIEKRIQTCDLRKKQTSPHASITRLTCEVVDLTVRSRTLRGRGQHESWNSNDWPHAGFDCTGGITTFGPNEQS